MTRFFQNDNSGTKNPASGILPGFQRILAS